MLKNKDNSDRTFKVIIVLAILLVLILGAGWFWSMHKSRSLVIGPPPAVTTAPLPSQSVTGGETKTPETLPETGSTPETPAKPDIVVHFDKSDEDFKKLMNRRKAKYGLKESVDMIVESDETLEVGGISVPMEEILEKIRLKSGQMVETDLGPTLSTLGEGDRIDRLYTQLKEKEKRFKELENDLGNALAETPETEAKREEYNRLREVVDDYYNYRDALSAIRDWELTLESGDLREKLSRNADVLVQQKKDLERTLAAQLGLTAGQTPVEEQLMNALTESRTRLKEIDNILKTPPEDITARTALVRERTALAERISALEKYEATLARIDKIRTLLAQTDPEAKAEIEANLKSLRTRADELEDALTDRLLPDEKTDAYGIYVVRPDDNIWNIHFQFLKENFKHRGITLSPVADEPDERGVSSGVGKILKFAEGLVYIYNIREHRLADDANIIQPLSKIIVFNMAKAIELIKKIDYEDIKHIQFDGETLWLPSG